MGRNKNIKSVERLSKTLPPKWLVPFLLHIFVFMLVLVVYHTTMSKGLVEIDSGELAAVQCTHGIAHPTGYVLYTGLGFLWSKLPFFPSVIYGLNFFACVCVALSANVVLGGVLKMASGSIGSNPIYLYGIGVMTAFSYAFWGLVWKQSTSVEVYSFQLLLTSLLMYWVVVVYHEPENKSGPYILGLFLGLVLGHHLMGIFLLPGLLGFLFWQFNNRRGYIFLQVLGIAIVCLLVQVGVLYLHALSDPELNWGDPSSVTRLWKHITGDQYRSSMLVSESYGARWTSFWKGLPLGVGYVSLPLAFVGLVYGFRQYIKINVFLLLTAGVTLIFIPLYAIRDIDNYFLPFYLVLAYWMALGLLCLVRFRKVLVIPFLLLPILLFLINKPEVDRSEDKYIDQYTALFFEKMPANTLYIGYAWDILISPTYYCQYCERQRADIDVLEKLEMGYSWYYRQLNPELFAGLEAEKEAWVAKLVANETGTDNDTRLQPEFTAFLTKLIAVNMGRRPVILAFEIFKNNIGKDVVLPANTMLVPSEFGFEVRQGREYVALRNYREPLIDFNGKDNFYTRLIVEDRVNLLVARCLYELQYQKIAEARRCLSVLQERYPNHVNTQKLSKMLK